MERDEHSKVRAYLRATNLDTRSNCGYNVLTGEGRKEMTIPNELQQKYQGTIDYAYNEGGLKTYNNSQLRKK